MRRRDQAKVFASLLISYMNREIDNEIDSFGYLCRLILRIRIFDTCKNLMPHIDNEIFNDQFTDI